jgi:hypothetical protein
MPEGLSTGLSTGLRVTLITHLFSPINLLLSVGDDRVVLLQRKENYEQL